MMPPWLTILRRALDSVGNRVVLFRCGNAVFVTFGLFAGVGALLSMTAMGGLLVAEGVPGSVFLLLVLAGSAAVVFGSWLAGQLLDYELLLRCWNRRRRLTNACGKAAFGGAR